MYTCARASWRAWLRSESAKSLSQTCDVVLAPPRTPQLLVDAPSPLCNMSLCPPELQETARKALDRRPQTRYLAQRCNSHGGDSKRYAVCPVCTGSFRPHHALIRELPRRATIIKVDYPNAVRRQLPAVPIIAKAVLIPCPCPATRNVSLRHMMKTMRTKWLRHKQLRVSGLASHVHNIHPTCRY